MCEGQKGRKKCEKCTWLPLLRRFSKTVQDKRIVSITMEKEVVHALSTGDTDTECD